MSSAEQSMYAKIRRSISWALSREAGFIMAHLPCTSNAGRRYHHERIDPLTRPAPDNQVLHPFAITYLDPSFPPDRTAQRESAAQTHARLGSRGLRQDHLTRSLGAIAATRPPARGLGLPG